MQHRAALASPSLPPPLPGSLRDACRKALQVKRDISASTPSPGTPKPTKRPRSVLSSSPSLPLAQRIRDDMDLLSEEESPSSSPIKETLREPCVPEAPLSLSPVGREAPPSQPLLLLTPSLLSQDQESETEVEVQQLPLPLCHYCCHRGNDRHPVHFYTVCICSDDECTCRCYCDDEQFQLKKQLFPSGLRIERAVGPEKKWIYLY